MTDLPPGWAWTTLGEIAETSLGKMLDRGKSSGEHLVPYLRNVNVQWGRIDLNDILMMDISPDERNRFELRKDDLLVCEGGEVGRCAIWPGGQEYMAFQKALHRVRPLGGIDPKFLRYYLEHMNVNGELLTYSTGSTIKHLPQQQLRKLPVKVPPLAEQRRIVAIVESYLSRLDVATEQLRDVSRRLDVLRKRIIVDAIPPHGLAQWKIMTVQDAGKVELGRQRHPDWHTGPNMRPYLRVANVFEDRIDVSDVMEMDFPLEVFERFRLVDGDILLNEGQSPEYLGRPAMYRGVPEDVAFTNSLLRFRAGPDVLPEWALLVFRRHMHAGRFLREVRITTNIAHLSAGRLKRVEFPVPPLDEQERIVMRVREDLDGIERFSTAVRHGLTRAAHLQRGLFVDAFAGRLSEQHSGDEPASVLLDRIQVSTRPTARHSRRTVSRAPQRETLL